MAGNGDFGHYLGNRGASEDFALVYLDGSPTVAVPNGRRMAMTSSLKTSK
ncbi:hypothetical protein [Levilactobacillus senmaizukei]|nr:hypothetical protein [Levilactobacillus senmaizukei]